MGHGISVICEDCGKKAYLTVGIGFMYPDIFQDTLEEIKQGKHGKEWQALCNSMEYVAVDAERYFFLCNKLPTIDNLIVLAAVLDEKVDDILVLNDMQITMSA